MQEFSISTTGDHPTRKWRYGPDPNRPLGCFANVKTTVTDQQVAISMNGTAVFTISEFRDYVHMIEKRILGERQAAENESLQAQEGD